MTEPSSSNGPSWVGCLIPVTAAAVILGFPTCVAVTGLRMDRAIAAFAEPEARDYGRGVPALAGEKAKGFERKLVDLQSAAREKRRVEVSFDVSELNHLVQTQELLQSLRNSTRVVRIGPAGLEVESSQPAKKLGGGLRYLNGVFVFRPVPSETNAWQLELVNFSCATSKQVPEGFLKLARNLHFFRFDLNAKELQEVLKRVERMDLREGSVVVVTREG
jgi:hypothetical protein